MYDGGELLTGMVNRYGMGESNFVYVSDAADVDRYDYWVQTHQDDVSVSAAQASTRATAIRHTHSIERVTQQVTLKLPASKVDQLCAGMTISIRSAASMGGENLGVGQPRQIAQLKWEPIAPKVGAVEGFYYAHMQLDRPLQVLAQRRPKVGPKAPTAGTAETLTAFEDWQWGEQSNPDAAQSETIANPYTGHPATAFGSVTACGQPNDGFGVVATYACHVQALTGNSAVMAASAGTVYRFDMTHVRYSPTYRIYVRFYNSADVQLSETVLFPTATPGTGWINTIADATAPTGTAWMRIDKDVGSPTFSAASVFFDRVTISTVAPAVAGDSSAPVGGTGSGSIGANSGAYANVGHVHEHDNLTTGGPYHMAEDVTFAPTGTISATNVQAAIAEVASEPSGVRLEHLETEHRLRIIAHRGDINPTDGYPENTLEGIRQAAIRGADGVEFDVIFSSDGTPHLMHDESVDRTTDGTGNLASKTDAQIAALNIDGGEGYNAGRHGTSLNVPTLAAALDAMRPYNVELIMHLNGVKTDAEHTRMAEYVRDNDLLDRTIILATSLTGAAAVKAVADIPVMTLSDVSSSPETEANVDIWLAHHGEITSEATVVAHAPEQVWSLVYTSEIPAEESDWIAQAWDYGAVGFMTNNLLTAIALRASPDAGTPEPGHWPRWNGSSWVNDAGLICVMPGTPTVDSGTPFGITVTSVWGVDATGPYYDAANVTSGDEAALFYDPLTDTYSVIEYDF